MDRGAQQAAVHRVTQSQTGLKRLSTHAQGPVVTIDLSTTQMAPSGRRQSLNNNGVCMRPFYAWHFCATLICYLSQHSFRSSAFLSSRILWSINSSFIEVKTMLMLQIIKFPSYIYFKLHGYTCIVLQCHSIHAFSYENFILMKQKEEKVCC